MGCDLGSPRSWLLSRAKTGSSRMIAVVSEVEVEENTMAGAQSKGHAPPVTLVTEVTSVTDAGAPRFMRLAGFISGR